MSLKAPVEEATAESARLKEDMTMLLATHQYNEITKRLKINKHCLKELQFQHRLAVLKSLVKH